MAAIVDRLMRLGEGRILRRLESLTRQVNVLADDVAALTDAELAGLTDAYRQRYADGESLDHLLPEAFATVREAATRVLGQRHYDVQLMGGAALHLGNIAEMRTGEGKTLVATLPSYLNALTGEGVHVVTVNDYLAARDAAWMGRVHSFLGLNVGTILNGLTSAERRAAYAMDITYGTNNEFGFDYLRDNMAWSPGDMVQRGHHFAIVDEVDSILVDEARTPLIISGPADEANKWYGEFARIATRMRRGVDYEVDERKRTIGVLEAGIEQVEDTLGIENLYESVNTPLVGFLNNAIKAKELYRRDKEYVVKDGEVLIVDEHTGRILAGRRYSEGMHQAIEAKEGVTIKQENQTLATITLQNYFRLYGKLAGMTGTAMTEAAEFDKIYRLGVVPIPTNRPMVRVDQPDLIYRTEEAKFTAVVADIRGRHERGQPVLVGTTSVAKSERLSALLQREGVPHSVLNAKQHEREAHIVAEAGRRGAVTVATNMAGRGTDVMLGGNPELLAQAEVAATGVDPDEDPEAYNHAYLAALARTQSEVAAEHEAVVAAGGLYVLGTERHESRRIDNQLRGRSGRQGDPGESRFYLSLQDDLMRRFKGDLVDRLLVSMNVPDDVPIEAKMVTNAIRNAQTQVEQQNFEIRKNVLKYDEVLNRQRQVIYAERRRVMQGEDISEQIRRFLDETIRGYVVAATAQGYEEEWDLEQLWTALKALFPVTVTAEQIAEQHGGHLDQETLVASLTADAQRAYDERQSDLSPEIMRELERQVMLTVLDRKWREHLYEMDYLQEGIGLRAMGQRDPLIEYQREGYDMFVAMFEAVQEEVVGYIFNVEVTVNPAAPGPAIDPAVAGAEQVEPAAQSSAGSTAVATAKGFGQRPTGTLDYSAPSLDGDGDGSGGASVVHSQATAEQAGPYAGTARNEPCPCGSGRKFKRCHGDPRARVDA